MTDVLFRFDVDAPPQQVLEAVKTTEGIKGFWTSRAEVPREVGEIVKVEFAIAPAPFDLLLERSDATTLVWRPHTFPPHCVGTTVRYGFGSNFSAPITFQAATTFTATNAFFGRDPFPGQVKEVDALGSGAGVQLH
jgi:hypothetical protein